MFSLFQKIFCPKSKTEEFKYIKMGDIYYPACEVVFLKESQEFKYTFIIDSGADISIIPKAIGEHLSLTKGQLRYLGGISGRMGYYINEIDAKIAGKQFKMEIAWATKDTVPLLLGRKSVFEHFHICFKEKNKRVFFN